MKDEDSSEGNFPLHAPPASSGVLHLAPIDEQRANKEAALQMAGLSPASSSFLPTSIAKRGSPLQRARWNLTLEWARRLIQQCSLLRRPRSVGILEAMLPQEPGEMNCWSRRTP